MSISCRDTPSSEPPALPNQYQRLPSSRPIDNRWDRSRGILFDSAKRCASRNCTWTPEVCIAFAAPRTYGTRAIGRSTAGSFSTPVSSSSIDGAHRLSIPFGVNQQEAIELKNEIDRLDSAVRDLKQTIEQKEEAIRRLKEDQGRQIKHAVERRDAEHKDALRRRDEKLSSASDKINQLYEQIKTLQAEKLQKKLQSERELQLVAEAASPRQHTNEDMKEWQQTINELRTTLTESEKTIKEKEAEVVTERTAKLNAISDRAIARQEIENAQKHVQNLKAQLNPRRSRKETDRTDYSTYSHMFDDFHGGLKTFQNSYLVFGDSVLEESELWRRTLKKFKKSNVYPLLGQNHEAIRNSIYKFMVARERHAALAGRELASHSAHLSTLEDVFGREAHTSRDLTRYHHFINSWPLHQTVDLVGMHAYTHPLYWHRKRLLDRAAELVHQYHPQRVKRERLELYAIAEVLRLVRRVLIKMRTVEKLKALLNGDLAEKRVYQASLTTEHYISMARQKYKSKFETSLYGSGEENSAGKQPLHERPMLRAKERDARTALRELQSVLRKTTLLEEDLGINEIEAYRLDEDIRRDLNTAQDELDNYLKELVLYRSPVGFRSASSRKNLLPLHPGDPAPLEHPAVTEVESEANADNEHVHREVETNSNEGSSEAANSHKTRSKTHPNDAKALVLSEGGEPSSSGRLVSPYRFRKARKFYPTRRGCATFSKTSSNSELDHVDKSVPSTSTGLRLLPTKARRSQFGDSAIDLNHAQPSSDLDSTIIAPRGVTSATLSLNANVAERELDTETEYSSEGAAVHSDGSVFQDSSSDSHSPRSSQSWDRRSSSGEPNLDQSTTSHDMNGGDHGAFAFADKTCPDSEEEGEFTLTHQMSPQDYRSAAIALADSDASYWSHLLYKNRLGKQPQIFYCTSYERSEQQAQLFLNERVLGFDLEWMPYATLQRHDIKTNVSLIQIAAEDKIGLFHLACFAGDTAEVLMPPSLRALLESPHVLKAGVNVINDSNRLQACLGVDMKGVFELSHLYRVVRYSHDNRHQVNFRLVSLAQQVADVLHLPLRKDDQVRKGRWSGRLAGSQTHYAAADAYAGLRLFHQLEYERRQMDPRPPRPACLELDQPLTLGDGTQVFRSVVRRIQIGTLKTTSQATATARKQEGVEDDVFHDALEEIDPDDVKHPFGLPHPTDGANNGLLPENSAGQNSSASVDERNGA